MRTADGPYPLPGVEMPAWILRFDKHGACASPATRDALLGRLRTAPPSDLIIFSHGWNNDFDEAVAMYAELMRGLEALCARHRPERAFDPVFVGIVWPSIWLSFEDGPAVASGALDGKAGVILDALTDAVAARGGPQAAERLYALLASPALDDAAAVEMARLIAPAFGVADDEGAGGRDTAAEDVLVMMRAMEAARPGPAMVDLDDIDDYSRPAGGGATAIPASPHAGGPHGAGGSAMLDPRNALRLFSLFQMKDRAGVVGQHGVAALLGDLVDLAPRVHAIGHSFGCKVMLAAACAQPMARPLSSLLLLQPAVSHLCFAAAVPGTGKPGGYRAALSPGRVKPPIVSTYSRRDIPLHETFHLSLRRASDLGEVQMAADGESTSAGAPPSRFAALGGYGPRGAGEVLVEPLPAVGEAVAWPAGEAPIVAFDGSQGAIQGHGDVTGPAISWMLHRLIFRG